MILQPDALAHERRALLKHIVRTAAANGRRTFAIGMQYMKNPDSRDTYYDQIDAERVKFILSRNHIVQAIINEHESSDMLHAVVIEVSHELGTPLHAWNTLYRDGAGTCFVEQGPLTKKRDHAGKRKHTGIPEPGQAW